MRQKYKILDWAGNDLYNNKHFGGKIFRTVEAADEALERHIFEIMNEDPDTFDWETKESEFYVEKEEYQIVTIK